MRDYVGRICHIEISKGGTKLFFTGKILEINDTHISFKDKFSKLYMFKREDIDLIHEIN